MEKRRVYGVPVFPGPSAAGLPPATSPKPTGRGSEPQQYQASPAVEEKTSTLAVDNAPPSSLNWKLRHIDFTPNLIKGKKDKEDDYEKFPALVERANQWSVQNPQALIFSCETVTWSAIDRQIFTDNGVIQRSMHSDKKSRLTRGLRVWYVVYDETFYETNTGPGPYKLGFINYVLEAKNDNFQTLLSKINGDMFKKTVAGKIMRIETLFMLNDVGDADVCNWSEQPDKSRDYVSFIRLFYVFKKDDKEDTKYGEVGICDFIPQFNQRTPHNQGYEVFADLWQRASRWLYISPQLQFISAQGLFVKVKKEGEGQSTTLWDRCKQREAASAYGSLTHQRTDYIQLLRVVYHQPPNVPQANSSASKPPQPGHKLFYKSFTPSALRRVHVPGSGGSSGDEPDPGPVEGSYEDLRQMEDKINAWLAYTGAKVHGVETIPTRLVTGGQETLGPEATFVYNDREKNQAREHWRVNVRLYLDGEFKEIPLLPRSAIAEHFVRGTSGSVTSLD